jgi:hypothetical protein
MYNTRTNTNTYTVIDIRKTFENCEADIRTIARRTNKWSTDYVDKIMHDIIKLAENNYLDTVSIALKQNSNDHTLRATKFSINADGNATDRARPGQNNDWENIDNTYLTMYLSYSSKWHGLSEQQKKDFQTNNYFRLSWSATTDDTSFSHLSSGNAQLYSSKGYELQKTNFK